MDARGGAADVEGRGVSFSWGGGPPVLDGADFRIRGAGLVPVVGANGAGKTTFCLLLMGRLAPSAGRVLVGGREPSRMGALERARAFAHLPQEADVDPSLEAGELLAMASFHRSRRYWEAAPGRGALEELGVAGLAGARMGELSGGWRRRVLLAAALLQGTPAVVLDEPFAFLDPRGRREARRLVEKAARDRLVVVATHDEDFVRRHFRGAVRVGGGRVVAAAGAHGAGDADAFLGEAWG